MRVHHAVLAVIQEPDNASVLELTRAADPASATYITIVAWDQLLPAKPADQRAGVERATSERVRRFSPGNTASYLHGRTESAAGFHHRETRRHFRAGLRAASAQAVLASERYGPRRVLGQIIG